MPRGDGTGPMGAGPGTGRGMGGGGGQGMGRGSSAGLRAGRMGGFAMGPGGDCVCPKCGKTVAHQQGAPCVQLKCPACGTTMTRAR
ncbi:MAG: DUF5320 family protein [Kiritimatiellia bacterium]